MLRRFSSRSSLLNKPGTGSFFNHAFASAQALNRSFFSSHYSSHHGLINSGVNSSISCFSHSFSTETTTREIPLIRSLYNKALYNQNTLDERLLNEGRSLEDDIHLKLSEQDMETVLDLLKSEGNITGGDPSFANIEIQIPGCGRTPIGVAVLFRCIATYDSWHTIGWAKASPKSPKDSNTAENRTITSLETSSDSLLLASLPASEDEENKRFFFACTSDHHLTKLPSHQQTSGQGEGIEIIHNNNGEEESYKSENMTLKGDVLIARMLAIAENARANGDKDFVLGGLSVNPDPESNDFTIFNRDEDMTMLKFWADTIMLERALLQAMKHDMLTAAGRRFYTYNNGYICLISQGNIISHVTPETPQIPPLPAVFTSPDLAIDYFNRRFITKDGQVAEEAKDVTLGLMPTEHLKERIQGTHDNPENHGQTNLPGLVINPGGISPVSLAIPASELYNMLEASQQYEQDQNDSSALPEDPADYRRSPHDPEVI